MLSLSERARAAFSALPLISPRRPNILDAITNGKIDIIINTPDDQEGTDDDSYIRKNAIRKRVFYVTTMAAAKATVEGIKSIKNGKDKTLKSLQKFHSEITE